MKLIRRFTTYVKNASTKDWFAMAGILLGLFIISATVIFVYATIHDKDHTIRTVRESRSRQTGLAEDAQADADRAREDARRARAQAQIAEDRLDDALAQARAEREFYNQLDCANTASVNAFIAVLSNLILSGTAPLTPEQRATLTASAQPYIPPDRCST